MKRKLTLFLVLMAACMLLLPLTAFAAEQRTILQNTSADVLPLDEVLNTLDDRNALSSKASEGDLPFGFGISSSDEGKSLYAGEPFLLVYYPWYDNLSDLSTLYFLAIITDRGETLESGLTNYYYAFDLFDAEPDANGYYYYPLDTDALKPGNYSVWIYLLSDAYENFRYAELPFSIAAPKTGTWELWSDNKWYFLVDGAYVKNEWRYISTSGGAYEYYYFDGSGAMQTGWQRIGHDWFYLQSDGAMKTGWQPDKGKWYYLDEYEEPGIMRTGWLDLSGTWYYMDSSGVMQTGWKQVGGSWYYFQSSGAMKTGWQQDKGKWYYFNDDGRMQTGWLDLSGSWYYLDGSGVMQTGWKQVGGAWYFLKTSGAMQTGWKQDGAKWFYLNPNGAMATGTQLIDGTMHAFTSSGVWTGELPPPGL